MGRRGAGVDRERRCGGAGLADLGGEGGVMGWEFGWRSGGGTELSVMIGSIGRLPTRLKCSTVVI